MCSIFECERCQSVDSIFATPQTSLGYECHRCKHGEWHDQFEEERYDFDKHGPALNKVNPDGGFNTSFS
ncbi:hypothetical protein D3C85_14180 [compost metagenome]